MDSIQHYVIKFVSDLRQVDGVLRVLWFPPPIKLIDFSKAFDKVWHKGLIHKMNCYGIKGNLLNGLKIIYIVDTKK